MPISKEGFTSESDGKFTVVLNTELTTELKELGLVREFISKVQSLRKEKGFEVTDHISISVSGDDEICGVLNKYSSDIKSGTLADNFEVKNVENSTEIELNDKIINVNIVVC